MKLEQLVEVCRRLNEAGVRYVLVGGFAVILHGYERLTGDVDFLVDTSEGNVSKIREALRDLLPEACSELEAKDVQELIVVRMIGEDLTIDLMKSIGDLDYDKVARDSFYRGGGRSQDPGRGARVDDPAQTGSEGEGLEGFALSTGEKGISGEKGESPDRFFIQALVAPVVWLIAKKIEEEKEVDLAYEGPRILRFSRTSWIMMAMMASSASPPTANIPESGANPSMTSTPLATINGKPKKHKRQSNSCRHERGFIYGFGDKGSQNEDRNKNFYQVVTKLGPFTGMF